MKARREERPVFGETVFSIENVLKKAGVSPPPGAPPTRVQGMTGARARSCKRIARERRIGVQSAVQFTPQSLRGLRLRPESCLRKQASGVNFSSAASQLSLGGQSGFEATVLRKAQGEKGRQSTEIAGLFERCEVLKPSLQSQWSLATPKAEAVSGRKELPRTRHKNSRRLFLGHPASPLAGAIEISCFLLQSNKK